MVDLIPLVLGTLGSALAVAVIIALRVRKEPDGPLFLTVIIAVASAALVGSYISFLLVDGDPDVWDFYASVWWLPIAVGGIVAVVVVQMIRRRKQGEVTDNM